MIFCFTSLTWVVAHTVLNVHKDQSVQVNKSIQNFIFWILSPAWHFCLIPVLFSVSCSHWKFKSGKNWTEEVSNTEIECNGFAFGILTDVLSMQRTIQPYGIGISCSWHDRNLMMGDLFHACTSSTQTITKHEIYVTFPFQNLARNSFAVIKNRHKRGNSCCLLQNLFVNCLGNLFLKFILNLTSVTFQDIVSGIP